MKISVAAILVGGAMVASQSGQAAGFVANDLYVGFQNNAGSASSDYIVNLGAASSIIGGSSVVDLSSYFSLSSFNTVLGSSSSLMGGVVGGSQNFATPDVYATQLRTSLGSSGASQSSAPQTLNSTAQKGAVSYLTGLNAPAAGSGVLDTGLSWQQGVEQTPTYNANTFYGYSSINPDSAIGTSSIVYEDLYYANTGAAFTYEGYFTFDFTGANASVTFTPAAVPEPSSLALVGGGCLLLMAVRRRSMKMSS